MIDREAKDLGRRQAKEMAQRRANPSRVRDGDDRGHRRRGEHFVDPDRQRVVLHERALPRPATWCRSTPRSMRGGAPRQPSRYRSTTDRPIRRSPSLEAWRRIRPEVPSGWRVRAPTRTRDADRCSPRGPGRRHGTPMPRANARRGYRWHRRRLARAGDRCGQDSDRLRRPPRRGV